MRTPVILSGIGKVVQIGQRHLLTTQPITTALMPCTGHAHAETLDTVPPCYKETFNVTINLQSLHEVADTQHATGSTAQYYSIFNTWEMKWISRAYALCPFNSHPFRWTWVSWLPLDSPYPNPFFNYQKTPEWRDVTPFYVCCHWNKFYTIFINILAHLYLQKMFLCLSIAWLN